MSKRGQFDVAVIGGGASGIMASIRASSLGFKVALVEANNRVGKKLLLTGDGRCNITNNSVDITNLHSSNKDFPFSPVRDFSNKDTIIFFKKLGIILVTLEDGRVFPITFQASSVLEILRLNLTEKSVNIVTNFKVKDIKKSSSFFQVVSLGGEVIIAKNVILATGGKSFPHTGSDGSGYELAHNLGHRIIEPHPSLVQLKLNFPYLKALSGFRFNGTAEIYVDSSFVKQSSGEILFTNYGVSGTAILNLSRVASTLLKEEKNVTLCVNFLPDLSYQSLIETFNKWIELHPKRSISDALLGVVNKRIIPVLLRQVKIEEMNTLSMNVSKESIERMARLLNDWKFEVSGTLTFATAQVTAGGVDTTEIDPDTLESKLVRGLYFAGEVLDVDGDSGGYNLQWAWSTGWVAGSVRSN